MSALTIVLIVLALFVFLGLLNLKDLIYVCAPNEVLIFSGNRRSAGNKVLGYRLIKGGRGIRIPLIEQVDRLDLTNMVIDVTAQNAYSKGGIPLTVQGVANVKIAGHEPVLNHAIERFPGKFRDEIQEICKATLEGALRGILATLTPEEVNEDKILFAEKLVHEVEQDMTNLGFVVDSFKIQNVQDEVQYLNSIGRKQNADIIAKARIAEAVAHAEALIKAAENRQQEVEAQITAQIEITKAETARKLAEIRSRRDALVAEERAKVIAEVARAKAEIDVQKARVEKMKHQYEAEVIIPAKADCEAAEMKARADNLPMIQAGRAKSEALKMLSKSYEEAGPDAKNILLMQKLNPILSELTQTIADTHIENLTLLGSKEEPQGGTNPNLIKIYQWLEQSKEIFGVDLVEKLKSIGKSNCQ